MDQVKDLRLVGYFLQRKNIAKITLVDLVRELQSNLFEVRIMKSVVLSYNQQDLTVFDSSVGDWKCQTRTSMIVDLAESVSLFDHEILNDLDKLILRLTKLLDKINIMSSVERQFLTKELSPYSLLDILKNYDLDYCPPQDLVLLSLCFLTTINNPKLDQSIVSLVSTNKLKEFINSAKTILCRLSIGHEQAIAQQYGSIEEQRALEQVEFKGIQYMTGLFSSFKSIYKKMLCKQQLFLVQMKFFCSCGGIAAIQSSLFRPQNNEFIEIPMLAKLNQIVSVIEAYQFPGSIEQLQYLLGVPRIETYVPESFYKSCACSQTFFPKSIKPLNDGLLAFFAQHPQFTNSVDISFEKLMLSNSMLEKEYSHFMTFRGFSRADMSAFYIRHMYPDTIQHVLQEQKELKENLKLRSRASRMPKSSGISTPDIALI